MPSSYTSSLRLTLPVQGELSGSWGNTVNTGITQLVDTAVAGTANITMTAADYTLTNNNGATDEARAMFLVLGGTPGAARNVICPAVSKLYFVTNNTTGGFAQTVKTSAGTGISVPNGASMVLRCDGTNVVEVGNTFGTLIATNNLGVGTSSPSAKLHVAGTFRQNDATSTYGYTVTTASNKTVTAALFGGGYFAWQTNNSGTDQLTLDASGNLGLDGTSPSAWFGYKALQTGQSSLYESGTTVGLSSNSYFPSAGTSWTRISAVATARYDITSGVHKWFADASGAAGGSFTPTERMTLDSSGNLGLGVTPSAWNADYKAIQVGANGSIAGRIGTSNTVDVISNGFRNTSGNWQYIATNPASRFTVDGSVGGFQWYTAPSGTAGNAISFTQAMTLDASGNLLVGLSSPAFVSTRLEVEAATNNNALGAKTTQNNYAPLMAWNSATTGDNLFQYFYTEGTLTLRGSITYNRAGGLVAYNTTSDYRAKDIIGPITNSGEVIDSLKVYEGKMKGATQSRPMLVAHEAQAVAPYCVTGEKDAVNEDGTPKYQQMDVSSLVPLLLAEIQSLRARVAALEAR